MCTTHALYASSSRGVFIARYIVCVCQEVAVVWGTLNNGCCTEEKLV